MNKWLMVCFVFLGLALSFACGGGSPTTTSVKKLPTIESFAANPTSIHRGESSTLTWSVKDATSVTIDQAIGTVSATGTQSVSPTATTTYKLTATNSDGTKTASCVVTIELVLPTIDYFSANPTSIDLGKSSTLSWSVTGATTISIDQGIGTVSATGTRLINPTANTTYTLTATNSDGPKTASCQVTVDTNVADVIMSEGPTYDTSGTVFQATGKLKNIGTKKAFNITVTLYFMKKAAWGGGLYMEYTWVVGDLGPFGTLGYEDPFEWILQWTGTDGWNMNTYVDTFSRTYKITWQ